MDVFFYYYYYVFCHFLDVLILSVVCHRPLRSIVSGFVNVDKILSIGEQRRRTPQTHTNRPNKSMFHNFNRIDEIDEKKVAWNSRPKTFKWWLQMNASEHESTYKNIDELTEMHLLLVVFLGLAIQAKHDFYLLLFFFRKFRWASSQCTVLICAENARWAKIQIGNWETCTVVILDCAMKFLSNKQMCTQ